MKNHRYIIMAALLAAAVSCNDNLETDPGTPIKFSAGIATKAFLTSDDLNKENTEITIWGYKGQSAFIGGETATYDAVNKAWTLQDKYYWDNNSDFAFFSYLTKDKDGHSAPAVTLSSRTLTLPAREFDLAEGDNAFDFCYSDVVYRPATKTDHSVVNLNLKHLYTAIGFSAHNYTGSTIEVKDVSLVGLKNSKSASINFANTGTEVTYGNATCNWTVPDGAAAGSKKLNSSTIILYPGVECANIVGVASTTPQYYMFWPQTSGELTAEGWGDSDHQPSSGTYLKIVYDQDGGTFTKYARFPQDNDGTVDLGWPAGTKRMMQIAFRKEQITLRMQVLDWDYSEPEIKYDDEVTVAQPLQFDSSTCTIDEASHKIFFNSLSTPVIGSFRLSAPSEATWIISKKGDFDAFEIDDVTPDANGKTAGRYGDHLDRNYGTVNETDGNSFTLYPMPVSAEGDYSIQLSFSIRYPDGESYCIDDKVQLDNTSQPVKWTIVFTK